MYMYKSIAIINKHVHVFLSILYMYMSGKMCYNIMGEVKQNGKNTG